MKTKRGSKKSIIFEHFCFNAININYNLNTHEVITSYFSFEKNIYVCLRVQGETKRSICFWDISLEEGTKTWIGSGGKA